ncbi:PREDICTED: uncharacterized protein LOC105316054 [Amphimedon queenslandica]|nr:PREDICTED: uncharacterized protein LOC105316054 [Amphimedon queenslandica]|eukprot:XP_011409153.1 PREDICTED: uncharacterized protein LOC105316054 [Amphimedon queenslandica]
MIDRIFCFVCRAFAHKVTGSIGRVDSAFTTRGTQASQWKEARKVLAKHQASTVHKQASLSYCDFLSLVPINMQLDRAAAIEACRLKEQQERNRQALYRIIDVITLLVRTGHLLRGHREGADSNNRGLFLEIVNLLSQYDGVLKHHFDTCPRNATYVSKDIQNDIISTLYHIMIEEVKKELHAASYFSVMMDEASDFGHKEQVAVVVRYVDRECVIQERFIDISSTDSTDAGALFQILLASIAKGWIEYR